MAKIEKVAKPKVESGRKVELKTEGVSGRLPAKSAFRPIECKLLENKLVISKGFDELLQRSFGKYDERKLELSFVEAIYLLEKGRISVKKGNKKLGYQELMDFGLEKDRRLHEKYIVYKDIRERGFVAKTGFKFGCDFRVYQRGVGVKKGPKAASEHTKWIVYTVPEDYACSFAELSRAVRLAHSIRAQMLWAIVDNENDVTYFEVVRIKP
ncbi:MAG TPA: tRNA-intron lyase [archaeon]|nr:tRNA-intron lyase [archaeon]